MNVFAAISLDPINVLCWLLVGAVAGFLAGFAMKGGGYGLIGDVVVGLIGAVIGGLLPGLLGLTEYGLIGTVVVAFIGACIFIALLRFMGPRRTNF